MIDSQSAAAAAASSALRADSSLVAAGAVATAVGLVLSGLAIALTRHWCRERVVFFARWGFSRVFVAAVLWIALGLAASRLPRPSSGEWSLAFELALGSACLGAVGLYALWQGEQSHPEGWRALGLTRPKSLWPFASGLASLGLLLPLVMGLGLLSGPLARALGASDAPQAVLLAFLDLQGAPLLAAIALAVLVQPLFEELLFRAFLQPLCVQNFGDRGGVALTSLVFAALHCGAGPAPLLPLFALSMLLGGLMLRTQNLLASYAVHACHNALALALLLCIPSLRELAH